MSDILRDPFESPLPNHVALGLDFGTTNTVAAYCTLDANSAELLRHGADAVSIRSLLNVGGLNDGEGSVWLGRAAEMRASFGDPRASLANFKSDLGCTKNRRAEFRQKLAHWASKDVYLDPEDAVAFVFKSIISRANRQLRDSSPGALIDRAIVGIPARASQEYRLALKVAAHIAGIDSILLVPEPIAACWTYFSTRPPAERHRLLVVDIGAGTTDLSLVDLWPESFRVLLTTGDNQCGGTSIDHQILRFLAAKDDRVVGSLDNFSNWQRIRMAKENANGYADRKLMLAYTERLVLNTHDGDTTMVELSGDEIHRCAQRVSARLDPLFRELFLNGLPKLSASDRDIPVQKIMLVGGGCKIRAFLDQLASIINGTTLGKFFKLDAAFNTETAGQHAVDSHCAVARGLALLGKYGGPNLAVAGERWSTSRLVDPVGLGVVSDIDGALLPDGIQTNSIHFSAFTAIAQNRGLWRTYGVSRRSWGKSVNSVELSVLAGEGYFVEPEKSPSEAERFLRTARCLGKFSFPLAYPRDGKLVSIGVLYEMDASGIMTVRARDLGCEDAAAQYPPQRENDAKAYRLDFGQLDNLAISKKRALMSRVIVRSEVFDETDQ